jgi:hypothetical protein
VGIGRFEKKWKGAFIVVVHKRIVSLENHFKFQIWLIIMTCITYFYHQKGSINKDDHVKKYIIRLQSKSLEGSMWDVNTKEWHYFMSLIRLWHSKWEAIIFQKIIVFHCLLVYISTRHSNFVQLFIANHFFIYWLKD